MNVILSQLNFGPKKFSCDAIIKTVEKVEKAHTVNELAAVGASSNCRQLINCGSWWQFMPATMDVFNALIKLFNK